MFYFPAACPARTVRSVLSIYFQHSEALFIYFSTTWNPKILLKLQKLTTCNNFALNVHIVLKKIFKNLNFLLGEKSSLIWQKSHCSKSRISLSCPSPGLLAASCSLLHTCTYVLHTLSSQGWSDVLSPSHWIRCTV